MGILCRLCIHFLFFFFFSSRRRHTRSLCDWSSDVCSSDLVAYIFAPDAFYAPYEDAPRLWGLSPERDQALGGILMQTEMALVFVVLMAHLFLKLLDENAAAERSGG